MNTTKSYTFLVGKTTFTREAFVIFSRRYLRAKHRETRTLTLRFMQENT